MTSREQAIETAARWFDEGHFLAELSRRIAHRTESQEAGRNIK